MSDDKHDGDLNIGGWHYPINLPLVNPYSPMNNYGFPYPLHPPIINPNFMNYSYPIGYPAPMIQPEYPHISTIIMPKEDINEYYKYDLAERLQMHEEDEDGDDYPWNPEWPEDKICEYEGYKYRMNRYRSDYDNLVYYYGVVPVFYESFSFQARTESDIEYMVHEFIDAYLQHCEMLNIRPATKNYAKFMHNKTICVPMFMKPKIAFYVANKTEKEGITFDQYIIRLIKKDLRGE